MPPPGTTPPRFSASDRSPFLSDDVEVRIAEKATEVSNWFTGKKSIFGFVLIAAGMLASWLKFDLPQDQIRDIWTWLEANWDTLVQGAGLITGVIGVIAKTMRHKKEVAVVKEVAKDLVVEAAEAKVETAKVEVALAKTEAKLEAATESPLFTNSEEKPKLQWGGDGTRTAGMVRNLPDGAWRSPKPGETKP